MGSRCHLEPLKDGSLVARFGGEKWKYGEPFELSLVVEPVDEDTCIVKGLDKRPTTQQWRDLNAALKERGYKFLQLVRIKVIE